MNQQNFDSNSDSSTLTACSDTSTITDPNLEKNKDAELLKNFYDLKQSFYKTCKTFDDLKRSFYITCNVASCTSGHRSKTSAAKELTKSSFSQEHSYAKLEKAAPAEKMDSKKVVCEKCKRPVLTATMNLHKSMCQPKAKTPSELTTRTKTAHSLVLPSIPDKVLNEKASNRAKNMQNRIEKLKEALKQICEGEPIDKVSQFYNISVDVLKHELEAMGRKISLTEPAEHCLVNHIKHLKSTFFSLSEYSIRRLGVEFSSLNKSNEANNNLSADKDWYIEFITKYPSFKPDGDEEVECSEKKLKADKGVAHKFLKKLEEVVKSNEISWDNIYSLSITQDTTHALDKKEKRISCIFSSNAKGKYVPPMIIYQKQDVTWADCFSIGASNGIDIKIQEMGKVNSEVFIGYIQHFITHVKPHYIGQNVLLLVDGSQYYTHSLEGYVEARKANIILMSVPKCLLSAQPLSFLFLKLMSKYFTTTVQEKFSSQVATKPFASIVSKAFEAASTPLVSQIDFEASGLSPFRPERVISLISTENSIVASLFDPNSFEISLEKILPRSERIKLMENDANELEKLINLNILEYQPGSAEKFGVTTDLSISRRGRIRKELLFNWGKRMKQKRQIQRTQIARNIRKPDINKAQFRKSSRPRLFFGQHKRRRKCQGKMSKDDLSKARQNFATIAPSEEAEANESTVDKSTFGDAETLANHWMEATSKTDTDVIVETPQTNTVDNSKELPRLVKKRRRRRFKLNLPMKGYQTKNRYKNSANTSQTDAKIAETTQSASELLTPKKRRGRKPNSNSNQSLLSSINSTPLDEAAASEGDSLLMETSKSLSEAVEIQKRGRKPKAQTPNQLPPTPTESLTYSSLTEEATSSAVNSTPVETSQPSSVFRKFKKRRRRKGKAIVKKASAHSSVQSNSQLEKENETFEQELATPEKTATEASCLTLEESHNQELQEVERIKRKKGRKSKTELHLLKKYAESPLLKASPVVESELPESARFRFIKSKLPKQWYNVRLLPNGEIMLKVRKASSSSARVEIIFTVENIKKLLAETTCRYYALENLLKELENNPNGESQTENSEEVKEDQNSIVPSGENNHITVISERQKAEITKVENTSLSDKKWNNTNELRKKKYLGSNYKAKNQIATDDKNTMVSSLNETQANHNNPPLLLKIKIPKPNELTSAAKSDDNLKLFRRKTGAKRKKVLINNERSDLINRGLEEVEKQIETQRERMTDIIVCRRKKNCYPLPLPMVKSEVIDDTQDALAKNKIISQQMETVSKVKINEKINRLEAEHLIPAADIKEEPEVESNEAASTFGGTQNEIINELPATTVNDVNMSSMSKEESALKKPTLSPIVRPFSVNLSQQEKLDAAIDKVLNIAKEPVPVKPQIKISVKPLNQLMNSTSNVVQKPSNIFEMLTENNKDITITPNKEPIRSISIDESQSSKISVDSSTSHNKSDSDPVVRDITIRRVEDSISPTKPSRFISVVPQSRLMEKPVLSENLDESHEHDRQSMGMHLGKRQVKVTPLVNEFWEREKNYKRKKSIRIERPGTTALPQTGAPMKVCESLKPAPSTSIQQPQSHSVGSIPGQPHFDPLIQRNIPEATPSMLNSDVIEVDSESDTDSKMSDLRFDSKDEREKALKSGRGKAKRNELEDLAIADPSFSLPEYDSSGKLRPARKRSRNVRLNSEDWCTDVDLRSRAPSLKVEYNKMLEAYKERQQNMLRDSMQYISPPPLTQVQHTRPLPPSTSAMQQRVVPKPFLPIQPKPPTQFMPIPPNQQKPFLTVQSPHVKPTPQMVKVRLPIQQPFKGSIQPVKISKIQDPIRISSIQQPINISKIQKPIKVLPVQQSQVHHPFGLARQDSTPAAIDFNEDDDDDDDDDNDGMTPYIIWVPKSIKLNTSSKPTLVKDPLSPVKEQLKTEEEITQHPSTSKQHTNSPPKKIKKKSKYDSGKTYCLVCDESYESNWIKCHTCQRWAHEACANLTDLFYYYCGSCLPRKDSAGLS